MPVPLPSGRLRRRTLLVGAGLAAAGVVQAQDTVAWDALRRGGAVALMRHADAPGIGDPAGWRLGDCTTQRNLSERGRVQARAAGERLRAERIAFARILSSPWCRCLETARLLDAGTVQLEETFGNAYVMSDRREPLKEGGLAVLGHWTGPGTLLVVTHGENIAALTGRSVSPAEIVVVSSAGGMLRELGSVRPAA